MLKHGEKIGIVGCSNGQKRTSEETLLFLKETLVSMGLDPLFSNCIYEKNGVFSGTARQRAECLMKCYQDERIREIFDVSGGDVANGVLPYLDYRQIAASGKRFWGYSDLTTVINAIYAKTGNTSVLYQIRNLIYDHAEAQLSAFQNTLFQNGSELYEFCYRFLQGNAMKGVVIGGNIRCLLKLAGTEYLPDFQNKILLLESYSGKTAQMAAFLSQLQQLGAFSKLNGILLGTFTQMEAEQVEPTIGEMIKEIVSEKLPIAQTAEIGHGSDAKAIVIGREYDFQENGVIVYES